MKRFFKLVALCAITLTSLSSCEKIEGLFGKGNKNDESTYQPSKLTPTEHQAKLEQIAIDLIDQINPADFEELAYSLLTLGERIPGVKNENTWKMVAATSSADANDVIFACDTYDNQLLTAPDGNNYFIGQQTLGLGVPAGRYGNFTRINFDGESVYRFGAGNVTYTATHQYFTIDAGKLVSAATAPTTAGDIYFTLRGTGTFVEGNSASFAYYDLVACKVNA